MKKYCVVAIALFISMISLGYDGELDDTFGGNGTISSNFDGAYDFESGIAIQSNNEILAAGQVGNQKFPTFALARYLQNGTLDTSFNGTGKIPGLVTTHFGNFFEKAQAQSALVDRSGKIVVAGYVTDLNDLSYFAIARYNADGSLDTSFNAAGKMPGTVVVDALKVSQAYTVALQSDDKIVVMGNSLNSFAVARYTKDGFLDKSFNTSGTATTDFSPAIPFGLAGVIQPDNKIIVAGYLTQVFGSTSFAMVRYTADGQLDAHFNADGQQPGVVVGNFGMGIDASYVVDIALQKDGKIILVGWTGTNLMPNCFALARYNSDGAPDTSFNSEAQAWCMPYPGKAGVVLTRFSSDAKAHAIIVQEDNKIIAGGLVDGAKLNFALARYYQNGTLDVSFNPHGKNAGMVVTNLGGSINALTSLALDSQGRLLAGGVTNAPGNYAFALARYIVNSNSTY